MTSKSSGHKISQDLSEKFGARFVVSASQLEHYAHDESYHVGRLACGIVLPRTTEEVAEIVKICAAHNMPVIPYGAGTSLEGHTNIVDRGIVIDLRQMDAILAVHETDMDCVCQPGVTREDLNSHLRDTGLFFPIDPGANATLGGMVATSASGTNAVRYGTMKENVISLEVVMADGSIIKTGRRPRKTSAGYDLTHLFIGSEGTLGIVTSVTLKLHGIPEVVRSATCAFQDLTSAVECVMTIIQLGIPVARIELMDEKQVEACNAFSNMTKPVMPTLFFEFHGTDVETEDHIERVKSVMEDYGVNDFDWATRPEDRSRLWAARHNALPAARNLRPGAEVLISDVAVPISRLADCIAATRQDIDENNLLAPIVGHVGDGNFHVFFVINPDDQEEMNVVNRVHHRLAMRAIEMDGTCTGEHGIGIGKKDLLIAEVGEEAVNVMRLVKKSLDPANLFNPGKIFDLKQANKHQGL